MKTDLKSILPGGVGFVAVGLLTYALFQSRPSVDSKREPANPDTSLSTVVQKNGAISKQTSVTIASAIEAAQSETDSSRRADLLAKWAESIDVDAVPDLLEATQTIADGQLREQLRAALLTSWSNRNLAGAVYWFTQHGGATDLHQQARDLLAGQMARQSPVEMVSWMEESLTESDRRELYGPFFRQWAATDPSAASALLGKMIRQPSGSQNTQLPEWTDLTGQLAAQWSNSDLSSAVNWAQSLPKGEARMLALKQVSYQWTQTDPQAAAAFALQQNDAQLLTTVAGKWTENNPQAAAAWARGMPAGDAQNMFMASIAAAWASTDPTAAANFIDSLPDGKTKSQAALAVISTWTQTSPAQTAQWISQFSEGSLRQQALKMLVSSWTETNLNDVTQWLQGLPQTPSRDVAVNAFSDTISDSSPALAFQWANAISNETIRNDQLQTVGRKWLQTDPASAQAAISQSSLPKYLKSKLLATASTSL